MLRNPISCSHEQLHEVANKAYMSCATCFVPMNPIPSTYLDSTLPVHLESIVDQCTGSPDTNNLDRLPETTADSHD